MSKATEGKGLESEKRANLLKDAAQKFFAEVRELCAKEQINIVPMIRPVGPPTTELVSMRQSLPATIWNKLRIKKYVNPEMDRLRTFDLVIRGIADKYHLNYFALISPTGAIIQVDFKPDYDTTSAIWTPPDMGKVTSPSILEAKK